MNHSIKEESSNPDLSKFEGMLQRLVDQSFGNSEQRSSMIAMLASMMRIKDPEVKPKVRKLFKAIGEYMSDYTLETKQESHKGELNNMDKSIFSLLEDEGVKKDKEAEEEEKKAKEEKAKEESIATVRRYKSIFSEEEDSEDEPDKEKKDKEEKPEKEKKEKEAVKEAEDSEKEEKDDSEKEEKAAENKDKKKKKEGFDRDRNFARNSYDDMGDEESPYKAFNFDDLEDDGDLEDDDDDADESAENRNFARNFDRGSMDNNPRAMRRDRNPFAKNQMRREPESDWSIN